jgi:hypothetical protein
MFYVDLVTTGHMASDMSVILVCKPEGRNQLGRPSSGCEAKLNVKFPYT